jgi:predicted DNA-binding transcriptional regulator YafY
MDKKREFVIPTRRMKEVDELIRWGMKTGQLMSSKKLAERGEVSSKTMTRLLFTMKIDHDVPLAYDPKRHGWYYTEKNYALPAVNVSEGDLFAICIAEKALQQYEGTGIYDDLNRVFQKILNSLPSETNYLLRDLSSNTTIAAFPSTETDGEIWKKVLDALREGQAITIWYQKPVQDAPASRKIFPFHVAHYHGSWYILGFCHARGEARVFNLSRIKKSEAAKETLAEERNREKFVKSFDPEKTLSESFDMYIGNESKTIKIRFTPAIAPYIRERKWHPNQELIPAPDGSLLFQAHVNSLVGMVPWILSWGSNAKVLEPAELVSEIQAELSRLTEVYG